LDSSEPANSIYPAIALVQYGLKAATPAHQPQISLSINNQQPINMIEFIANVKLIIICCQYTIFNNKVRKNRMNLSFLGFLKSFRFFVSSALSVP
jgi:hypothetical protein